MRDPVVPPLMLNIWRKNFCCEMPYFRCMTTFSAKKGSFWPFFQKWRHTSKIRRHKTNIFFFRIFYKSRETTFFMIVMPENDTKRVETTHFCRKLLKRRLFGSKMTSYSKNETTGDKNFSFQNILLIKGINFFFCKIWRISQILKKNI